ncbi:MAG: EAL domain-containing protein [Lysobacterales bacterium]|nr:MAG: EAL domain-containing protein [Xanthomonadales bacterium]
MHSVSLLVTDRSPESAERINSLLRNSGIKIHVIHARASSDVKRSLDHDSPVLILYADADESDAPLEEVSELAGAFNVPLALYSRLNEPEKLAAALSRTACFVINADREDLLTDSVSRLIRNCENDRNNEARQQRLEELEHRYDLLLDSSRDAFAYIHEGLHVYANRAYLEALRVSDESDIAGLSLLDMVDAGETNLKTLLKGFAKGSFPANALPVTVTRPDGSNFEANLVFSPARYDGEDCTQMMMQRRDAANELAAEIERLRCTDPLTQLHNRKAFVDELEVWVTGGRGEGTAAVLYIEPDSFDELQDGFSVDVIDAIIAGLAGVIRGCLSEGDIPARINERGFAVLAHRSTAAELESLAQKIRAAYRGHLVEVGDHSLTVSCSIGLSNVGRLVVNSVEIIARARKAQAEAATSGDQVVVFRPQLTAVASVNGEQQWLERVKYALSNHDFYTVQQSIIDLDGEGVQLVENITYMRGESGDHGPADFQDVADRSDLAGTIDRQIIPGLLKTLVENDERHIINVSSNSIIDYAFPGWFAEQLKSACVDGNRVILQITAQSALGNLRPAQRLAKELGLLGCRLAVSMFDSERRTCQLLEHLDVAYVKLHPALTEELTANAKHQEAVRRIVETADAHGVAVIADEVTNTSSLAVLWQCGVKLIAGAFLRETTQVLAQ